MPWHEKVLIGVVVVIALIAAGKWLLDQLNKGMD